MGLHEIFRQYIVGAIYIRKDYIHVIPHGILIVGVLGWYLTINIFVR